MKAPALSYLVVGLYVCSLLTGSAHAQQSASYIGERVTLSASVGSAQSASFQTTVVLGQEGPSGGLSVCNDGWIGTAGFFSVLGTSPVPIVLQAARESTNPSVVRLEWSGAVDFFDVYRVTGSATAIGDPGNLDSTLSTCTVDDSDADSAALIFYRVVPQGGSAGPPP